MNLECAKFLEAYQMSPKGTAILLDVRNDDEVAEGLLKEALHIPLPDLPARLGELPRDKSIYIYCRSGARAGKAKDVLERAGFSKVVVAAGGGYEQLSKL